MYNSVVSITKTATALSKLVFAYRSQRPTIALLAVVLNYRIENLLMKRREKEIFEQLRDKIS
jgi:hypothetical protein